MDSRIEEIFGKQANITPYVYNEAKSLEAKRTKKIRSDLIEDTLINSLQNANYLNEQLKTKYITLASYYISDMEENIMSTQFTLAKKYPNTSVDDWANFLKDKVVYTYIRKHRNAILAVTAEKNLADPYARNKRDNLSLIKSLENSDPDYKPIVILRIPDKYEEDTRE